MTGFYYLLQLGLKLFLLFVLSLYLVALLFKYLSIILEDVRENGRRHNDIEER